MRYSKFIVMIVIALNLWFTYRVLEIFEMTGQEPHTIIGAFFAFTCGELWMLSKITRDKNKEKQEDEVREDEKDYREGGYN